MLPRCVSVKRFCSPDFGRLVVVAHKLRAAASSPDTSFHVTFALRRKRTLAYGINKRDTTHPRNCQLPYIGLRTGVLFCKEIGLHSELACVLRLGRDECKDITFVNIRIGLNGQVTMAKPCYGCGHLFRQVGFRNVFYSNPDGQFTLWDPTEVGTWAGSAVIRRLPDGINLVEP